MDPPKRDINVLLPLRMGPKNITSVVFFPGVINKSPKFIILSIWSTFIESPLGFI